MTKFHFAGRYNGDPESLITEPHKPDYVPFKEAQDMNKLSLIMNGIAIVIAAFTVAVYFIVGRQPLNIIGTILSLVAMVPHEFLHAICFKEDVYMYENLRKGMLFVVGPGTFTKAEFVFMSMLPNLVFGFIPFLIFLIDPVPYINEKFPRAYIMTANQDPMAGPPAQEVLTGKLKELGIEYIDRTYGTKEESLGHVFHCNIRTAAAKKCNDEECAFFLKG